MSDLQWQRLLLLRDERRAEEDRILNSLENNKAFCTITMLVSVWAGAMWLILCWLA